MAVARVLSAAALKATLRLPAAGALPMRGSPARERAAAPRLTTALYRRQSVQRAHAARWRIADGPPYANGALHAGHFLNKV